MSKQYMVGNMFFDSFVHKNSEERVFFFAYSFRMLPIDRPGQGCLPKVTSMPPSFQLAGSPSCNTTTQPLVLKFAKQRSANADCHVGLREHVAGHPHI